MSEHQRNDLYTHWSSRGTDLVQAQGVRGSRRGDAGGRRVQAGLGAPLSFQVIPQRSLAWAGWQGVTHIAHHTAQDRDLSP